MKEFVVNVKGLEIKVFQKDDGKFIIPNFVKELEKQGTCLKPAFEPVIVARKPFKGSLVDNVLEYGVGGINIDECRIPLEENYVYKETNRQNRNGIFAEESAGTSSFINSKNHIASASPDGRFPANIILSYNDSDYDEVCGGMPIGGKNGSIKNEIKNTTGDSGIYGSYGNTHLTYDAYQDEGSAARYFAQLGFSKKDDVWKYLFVNNAENNLEILQAIKENIVQMNVAGLLNELIDLYAKCVENQSNQIETSIVQDIVEILTWDFKIETSRVIQGFIGNYKKCIQLLNLVQFVEQKASTDTTRTIQNLLKLFGYVRVVITNYILGNVKFEQRRYLYEPKASKKDRNDGCDKNNHPCVKPTELVQYLIRLVTPNGGTILDPFNGSGSTGKAAMFENKERNKDYKYIGIELDEDYLKISKARIDFAIGTSETNWAFEPTEKKEETKNGKYQSLW